MSPFIRSRPTRWGWLGFFVSLVGLVSCGLLSPIGLLLSLVGLFKEPRGFAIAGSIIGGLGSIFMAFVGLTLVMGLLGLGAAVKTVGDTVQTMGAAQQAAVSIRQARDATGTLPGEDAGAVLVQTHTDAWNTPLRYETTDTSFTIISAGPDAQFNTDDDLEWTDAELPEPNPSPSRGSDIDWD